MCSVMSCYDDLALLWSLGSVLTQGDGNTLACSHIAGAFIKSHSRVIAESNPPVQRSIPEWLHNVLPEQVCETQHIV